LQQVKQFKKRSAMDAWEKKLEKLYKMVGTADEFKLAELYNERVKCGDISLPIIYRNDEETFCKLIWEQNVTAMNVLKSAFKGEYNSCDAFVRVLGNGLLETSNSIYNWVPVDEWIDTLEKANKPIIETDINFYGSLKEATGEELETILDSELCYNCECYDGYAICTLCEYEPQDVQYKKIRVKYPTLAEVLANEEMWVKVLEYRGLYNLTKEDITFGDIMMRFAEVVVEKTIYVICRDYAYEKYDSYEKGTLGAYHNLEEAKLALENITQEAKDGIPSRFDAKDIQTERDDMKFSLWWDGRYPEYHYDAWIEVVKLR
jgi:hypothetical protein